MAEEGIYKKDGTTDFRNKPAVKHKTGTWKTCPYILGNCICYKFYIGVFFLGLYLIALGTGGIKPCVSSFGADQFDDSDETEKKHKSSFFNWFYFSINIGTLVASSVLVWIQTNIGWGWGFGIPAVAMAIAVVSFFSGTKLYRNQRPGGSPLTRIFQVMVASVGKARVEVPNDKSLLHFFDKAAVVTSNDQTKGSINPWKLCTITQIEEHKSIIRLLLIWATGCAEVFTFIGQLEFFYGQAPDAMRSLCSALSLTTAALGNYLSTFLVNIVADFSTRDGDYGWIPDNLNYGHLHYFFWLLAVLSVLNLGVYFMVARWYTFKKAPI
ncbi:hypothetical protein Goklo_027447 [Gossypium klotzschianum]|uniref:Uncharacterized protein n=1 Tax=Gossypium klotzschianum TaxID=34286 RepID=A0A7J8TY96_9ROSI|nr:hypothetical protein [Gossypium klotzschianum]